MGQAYGKNAQRYSSDVVASATFREKVVDTNGQTYDIRCCHMFVVMWIGMALA